MKAIAETRVAVQAVEPKAQGAMAGVTETTGIAAKIQLEREAIDRRIQQNGNRLQALQNAWQTLAGDKQWSDAALTEAVAGLRKDYENHQSAEQKLHQADTLLRELSVMEKLGRLRAERKPIVAERDRLNRHCEAASSIRFAYSEKRQQHIKQQMAQFVRIISALFTRMQSNLVYDGVALKEEGKLTFQLDHNLGAGHCHTPLIVRSA